MSHRSPGGKNVVLVACILSLVCSGCYTGAGRARMAHDQIEVGMSPEHVLSLLGDPDQASIGPDPKNPEIVSEWRYSWHTPCWMECLPTLLLLTILLTPMAFEWLWGLGWTRTGSLFIGFGAQGTVDRKILH